MRIYLSPPDVGAIERELVLEAVTMDWGKREAFNVDRFEHEFAEFVGVPHAVAVSSGTAALHLSLLSLGIGPGDTVLVPTFTFAATAFAVAYAGATPVFIDSERATWNVDPDLLEDAICQLTSVRRRPKAVVAVDLYGRCADYARIETICERHSLALIEDAAEALGSTALIQGRSRKAGTFGEVAAFSFNGNKIITSSGGGMVTTSIERLANYARKLSRQWSSAQQDHGFDFVGFDYEMSPVLSALGSGQLKGLAPKIARRHEINATYRKALADLPGVSFDPATEGRNCWLSCLIINPFESNGVSRGDVELALASAGIESRPLWKPMHRQPVFHDSRSFLNGVSDELFQKGLCLPSGSSLTDDEQSEIIDVVRSCWG